MNNTAKVIAAIILIPLIGAAAIALMLAGTGLAVGSVCAMILEQPFKTGWDAVWDRPLWAVLWAVLFFSPNAIRN